MHTYKAKEENDMATKREKEKEGKQERRNKVRKMRREEQGKKKRWKKGMIKGIRDDTQEKGHADVKGKWVEI